MAKKKEVKKPKQFITIGELFDLNPDIFKYVLRQELDDNIDLNEVLTRRFLLVGRILDTRWTPRKMINNCVISRKTKESMARFIELGIEYAEIEHVTSIYDLKTRKSLLFDLTVKVKISKSTPVEAIKDTLKKAGRKIRRTKNKSVTS